MTGRDARTSRIGLGLSVAVLSAGVAPRAAEAVSEDEWHLGATGAYAFTHVTGSGASGGQAGIEVARGWRGGLSGLAGLDVVRAAGGRAAVLGALGGAWALDVLRFVPFAELAAVGGAVDGDGAQLGARIGVGLEYFVDRRWTLSPVVRCAWLPLAVSGPGDDSLFVSVGVRVAHVFF